MKRFRGFLIVSIISAAVLGLSYPVLAEEKAAYALSFGFESGIFYGTSTEIVYTASGSSQYLSELQWNVTPLFFMGLSAEYGIQKSQAFQKNSFFGKIEIDVGLPFETGVIEDRDWKYPASVPGSPLTHFSSHRNQTKAAIVSGLSGGGVVALNGQFPIKGISYPLLYVF
jgi:outer membrane protease